MTAFTGALTVAVNTVAYTNWIDYSVQITKGYDDIDAQFQPGVATLRLIGNSSTGFNPVVGDVIAISDATLGTLFTGRLTDVTISMVSYGQTGDIVQADLTVMGATFDLLNAQWYLDADTTTTVQTLLNIIVQQAGQTQWYEVNPSLTWAAVDPTVTWAKYSDKNSTLINGAGTYTMPFTYVKLTAGTRNAWDDINLLMQSIRGHIVEMPDGQIRLYGRNTTPATASTLTADIMSPYLSVSRSLNDIRNSITITNESGTSPIIYRDDESVYQYGENDGAISTALTNTGDVDTLGQLLLDLRAYPVPRLRQLEVDLTNPNMTATVRTDIRDKCTPNYIWPTTGIPAAFGGDNNRVVIGSKWDLSKANWAVNLNILDYNSYWSHPMWTQISKLYTWTSYGAAFPTQKWSDL